MKYALLIYADEAGMASTPPDQMNQILAAYGTYTEAMRAAGAMVGAERLRDTSAATTVRTVGGKTTVLDGPYADAKEQLAGFYLVDAPDLDAAVAWAARCPGAELGVMEVRPIF